MKSRKGILVTESSFELPIELLNEPLILIAAFLAAFWVNCTRLGMTLALLLTLIGFLLKNGFEKEWANGCEAVRLFVLFVRKNWGPWGESM